VRFIVLFGLAFACTSALAQDKTVIARIPALEHTCGYGCIGEPYDGSYTSKTKKLFQEEYP
jgi:hypothetical protein